MTTPDNTQPDAVEVTQTDRVLIWSGEHHAYWRPDSAGYTIDGLGAGVYTRAEFDGIVRGVGPEKKLQARPIDYNWPILSALASTTGATQIREALAPLEAMLDSIEGRYGFGDKEHVDTGNFRPPYNQFKPLTFSDLRRLRAALTPPDQPDALSSQVATVDRVETVPLLHPFDDTETSPIWRVAVGEYCADFDYEQAARNFAGAINAALSSRAGEQARSVPDGNWPKDKYGLAEGDLNWSIPVNLRWLAEQSSWPPYMPCGQLTGAFLFDVAKGYERIAAAPAPEQPSPDRGEVRSWRCYHCDEVFTDDRCARLHFGPDEDSEPACIIKAGAEQGLLGALREAEKAAGDAWFAIHNEATDAAKAYYAQSSRHHRQLRIAEEAGYERGLADAPALSASPTKETAHG